MKVACCPRTKHGLTERPSSEHFPAPAIAEELEFSFKVEAYRYLGLIESGPTTCAASGFSGASDVVLLSFQSWFQFYAINYFVRKKGFAYSRAAPSLRVP